MAARRKRYAALVSGGLDSAVALKLAAGRGEVAKGLFFDYGQRAVLREREAARAIAAAIGTRLEVIDIRWLGKISPAAIVEGKAPLPVMKIGDLGNGNLTRRSARAVWVPNRNAVMVSIAAAYAEALGCGEVVAGFNREEGATFPDNSQPFVRAMNAVLRISTSNKVRLYCPLIDIDKARILKTGMKINAPLHAIWSCYEGGKTFCWKCESCARLGRALAMNKKLDWFRRINPHAGE
jgi:7-cyano-7-deazaguanine synthase